MTDRVDKAFEIIKGYCSKQTGCDTCRFLTGNDGCYLMSRHVPCDWKKPLKTAMPGEGEQHDYEKVVRCKDCKRCRNGCQCDVPLGVSEMEKYILVDEDDFCSYGERKETK